MELTPAFYFLPAIHIYNLSLLAERKISTEAYLKALSNVPNGPLTMTSK